MDTSELEVRLPIPLRDAGFADLPIGATVDDGPAVELRADFAGSLRRWRGQVVRVEAELDRATRQLTAVARVRPGGEAPLLVGMFVEAVIAGSEHEGVYVVPRDAMVSGDGCGWWRSASTTRGPAPRQAPGRRDLSETASSPRRAGARLRICCRTCKRRSRACACVDQEKGDRDERADDPPDEDRGFFAKFAEPHRGHALAGLHRRQPPRATYASVARSSPRPSRTSSACGRLPARARPRSRRACADHRRAVASVTGVEKITSTSTGAPAR